MFSISYGAPAHENRLDSYSVLSEKLRNEYLDKNKYM